ncbi:T9SS type A sorting domain-containing protein [bacterium]|nr:T9SS type A sorting domain-containing protein [bacterium]
MKTASRLICIALFLQASISLGSWIHLPGEYNSIICAAADSSEEKWIVGLFYGGFWLTENGGTTWEPINDRIFSDATTIFTPLDVTCVDTRCDTIIIRYDLYPNDYYQESLSVDGGQTWQRIRPDLPTGSTRSTGSHFTIVDQSNHNTLMHTDGMNFSKSEDFGLTWETGEFGTFLASRFNFFQDPIEDSTLFVVGPSVSHLEPEGVRRSDDLGENWFSIFDPVEEFNHYRVILSDICRLQNGDLLLSIGYGHESMDGLVVTNYDYLMRSSDDGVTWDITAAGSWPETGQIWQIQPCQSAPQNILIRGTGRIGTFLSTDLGYNFEPLHQAYFAFLDCMNISVNQHSGKTYLCSYVDGLWSSTDGLSWERYDSLPKLGGMTFITVTENMLFSLRTEISNLEIYSFETEDWSAINGPLPGPDTSVYLGPDVWFDSDMVYVSTNILTQDELQPSYFQLFEVNLESESWYPIGSTLSPPIRTDPYRQLFWESDGVHLIAGIQDIGVDRFGFAVSMDTSRSWISHEAPWSASFIDVAYHITTLGLVVAVPFQGVFLSDDFGETWNTLDFPSPAAIQDRPFLEYNAATNELFLFSANQTYNYSADEWTSRGNTSREFVHMTHVPGDPPVLIANTGYRAGLHFSFDRGGFWGPNQHEQLPYSSQFLQLGMMQYDPWRNRVWLSTRVGLMYINVNELAIPEEQDHSGLPGSPDLLEIFPNPANASTVVRFSLQKPGETELQLINNQGQVVKTLMNEALPLGEHQFSMDASLYASGTYFLTLHTGSGTTTRKLTILK